MLHHSIPTFCLQTDAELSLLRVEYLLGVESKHRRYAAAALMELARQQSVRHLLIDMRSVPPLSVSDELWLSTHFVPALLTLPLQRLVLLIGSHQTYHQLTVDALHNQIHLPIRFDAQYFDEPEAALHWLTDDSPQVAELLAEWADCLAPVRK